MTKKIVAIVLVLAVGALGIWYVMGEPGLVTQQERFVWSFRPIADADVQLTKIDLTYNGTTDEVATYPGRCAELPHADLAEGAVSGVFCWQGTRGDGLEIFSEGGAYVLKHVTVQSTTGKPEDYQATFQTLHTLE